MAASKITFISPTATISTWRISRAAAMPASSMTPLEADNKKVFGRNLIPLGERERWYVAYTRPHCEARAQIQLKNQGFCTFLPRRLQTIRHARKLTNVLAPFFPRYLFVVLDLTRHQWRSISGTIGVANLVMQGDLPHPVPQGVVETLVASADALGLLQIRQQLRVGGAVRLAAGPFAEQLAILDSLDDSGRIRVLLDILGRQVLVSTECNSVFPIASAPPLMRAR
jgi:transcription elongation factor/antiterminator RfaH